MASNTPETTTKSSSNINPTPNNPSHTPSDVRSVTQTQDSERSFVTLDSAPDHQHMLNAPCAAEQVHNTPKTPIAPTPVIPSPDRVIVQHNVVAELFMLNSKAKRLSETARNTDTTIMAYTIKR